MTEAAIIALAVTGLAANLFQPKLLRLRDPSGGSAKPDGFAATAMSLVRAGQPLGLFLSTVPVLLGLILHLRATYQPFERIVAPARRRTLSHRLDVRAGHAGHRRFLPRWRPSLSPHDPLAVGHLLLRHGGGNADRPGRGCSRCWASRTWDELAPLVMVVPIVYMISARLYRGHTQENPLVWVAHSATGVMIVAVLAAAMHLTPQHVFEPVAGTPRNLLLAAFFAEAALFYALAAAFRKQGFNVYLGTAAACGALWQLLQLLERRRRVLHAHLRRLGPGAAWCAYRLAMLEWTGLAAGRVPVRQFADVAVVRGGGADDPQPAGIAAGRNPLIRSCCCWSPWWLSACWRRGWFRMPPAGDGTSSWRLPRPDWPSSPSTC